MDRTNPDEALARSLNTSNLALGDLVLRCTRCPHFVHLSSRFDFLAEGRRGFAEPFETVELQNGDPAQFMWFVWCVAQPGWEAYNANLNSSKRVR
jgi:hypothetical protein